MRYLSEQMVIDKFAEEYPLMDKRHIKDTVATIKTAFDAEPVVRCEECGLGNPTEYGNVKCCISGLIHSCSFFCASGERRGKQ